MQGARLERLALFENLTPKERAELEVLLEPASFEAGEEIFEEGSPEECLYVLTYGTVEVHKEVSPDRQQHLATIEAPAVVGEIGLMTESPATATVTVRSPVQAWRLPRETFLEKLESGSDAAFKVAYEIGRILAERMARTDESIAKIVAQLEDTESNRDFEVFRDKLMQEWSF
ncbi:MAG: cyclic nucleotide-binding domain-containing protein [Actinomycetota bacterium]|nr:cyclic nucleotide-binding domain-containing protein [Actinomycetota bacterium]